MKLQYGELRVTVNFLKDLPAGLWKYLEGKRSYFFLGDYRWQLNELHGVDEEKKRK